MRKKIRKTGSNRTSNDGYYALIETQRDIDLLIKDFDQNENPKGRTLCSVCSRAIEELKIATSSNKFEIFSLNNQEEYHTNPLISIEETVYASLRQYKFFTKQLAVNMNRFPLLRPSRKLILPKWKAEAAFIINFTSKKPVKFSRDDVISTIRNDIGAHFVEDITSRYALLSKEHQEFTLSRMALAGPPGLINYLERPVSFYNSPLPYIIRSIAAEIQATIYDVLRRSSTEKTVEEVEKDLGEVIVRMRVSSSSDNYSDEKLLDIEEFHKKHGVALRE